MRVSVRWKMFLFHMKEIRKQGDRGVRCYRVEIPGCDWDTVRC